MSWTKTLIKSISGLIAGLTASAIANPEAITTITGAKHSALVGAIVALISGLSNYIKHRKDI